MTLLCFKVKDCLWPSFSFIPWGPTPSIIPPTWARFHYILILSYVTTSCQGIKCFEALLTLKYIHTQPTSTHQATPWTTFLLLLLSLLYRVPFSMLPFPHHLILQRILLDNHWRILSNSLFSLSILLGLSAASHCQQVLLLQVICSPDVL